MSFQGAAICCGARAPLPALLLAAAVFTAAGHRSEHIHELLGSDAEEAAYDQGKYHVELRSSGKMVRVRSDPVLPGPSRRERDNEGVKVHSVSIDPLDHGGKRVHRPRRFVPDPTHSEWAMNQATAMLEMLGPGVITVGSGTSIESIDDAKDSEFNVVIEKQEGAALGLQGSRRPEDRWALRVDGVKPGPIQEWNERNPSLAVDVGCLIISANGISGDAAKIVDECKKSGHLELVVRRQDGPAVVRAKSVEEAAQADADLAQSESEEDREYEKALGDASSKLCGKKGKVYTGGRTEAEQRELQEQLKIALEIHKVEESAARAFGIPGSKWLIRAGGAVYTKMKAGSVLPCWSLGVSAYCEVEEEDAVLGHIISGTSEDGKDKIDWEKICVTEDNKKPTSNSVLGFCVNLALLCLIAFVYKKHVSDQRAPFPESMELPDEVSMKDDPFNFKTAKCAIWCNGSACLYACCCPGARIADTLSSAGVLTFWGAIALYLSVFIVLRVLAMASIMDTSVHETFILAIIFVPLRMSLRRKFGAPPNSYGCCACYYDFLLWWWCTPCAIAQEGMEVDMVTGEAQCCCKLGPPTHPKCAMLVGEPATHLPGQPAAEKLADSKTEEDGAPERVDAPSDSKDSNDVPTNVVFGDDSAR